MGNDKKHKKRLEHNQKNERYETQINLPPRFINMYYESN